MKRLSRYCKLDIIELPDEKTPENAGEQLNLAIKAKEGDRILSSLKDDAYVIALAIEGKMLDSVEFSGVFSSGSSIISSLQYLDSLFTYSQTACT